MNSENWAKIREIIKKTGEKVVVLDPQEGEPLMLMSLNAYEKLVFSVSSDKLDIRAPLPGTHLTPPPAPGIIDPVRSRARDEIASPFGPTGAATSNGIDPDLSLLAERQGNVAQDWGGDEEDRYYMEPAE